MSNKIHGVKVRDLPDGSRGPDCCWLRRYVNHVGARLLFHAVPTWWMQAPGWRRQVWEFTTENFGWWFNSHKEVNI